MSGPGGNSRGISQAYVDRSSRAAWDPTGILENLSRFRALANIAVLSTGRLSLVAGLVIPAGKAINTLTAFSGTTAPVLPTNQWFCLTDMARNVLVKTVDDGTTAWAANSEKGLATATTWTPTVDTPVYFGIMVAATTTVPSLSGLASAAASIAVNGKVPIISGLSSTGLTNPASLGATAAALTAVGSIPYVQAS
jgi:hypothetical protein